MARISGTPQDIFESIKDRLKSQVAECTDSNLIISLNPAAKPSQHPGDFSFTIAPTSGKFNDAAYDGGGLEQLTVNGGVVVAIHSTVMLDEVGRDEKFLSGEAPLGIWQVAAKVINALADPSWSPTKDGSEITRDPMYPLDYAIARDGKNVGRIEITFVCNFDWDVTP